MQANSDSSIACSLPAGALAQRLAWIRRVTAGSLLTHQLDGTRVRLRYRAEALSELQKIIVQERECCPFLNYSLQRSADVVELVIEAPDHLGRDAQWVFDQFLPQVTEAPKRSCGCAPGACG